MAPHTTSYLGSSSNSPCQLTSTAQPGSAAAGKGNVGLQKADSAGTQACGLQPWSKPQEHEVGKERTTFSCDFRWCGHSG